MIDCIEYMISTFILNYRSTSTEHTGLVKCPQKPI